MSDFAIEKLKPETSLCTLEVRGPVAYLTLTREDVYNALNVQLISEIISLLDWTKERSVGERGSLHDSSGASYLRVLVFSGAGKHFCAGADINMMRDAGAKSAEENRIDSERLDRLFNSLWAHPCFTIGKVQGVALGGGAGLIACLDHVIVEPKARIALSEGKLGILPAVIGPYVYRKVGSAEFRRLSMMAGRIGAEESLRIGLVNQLSESLEQVESSIIDEVLTTGPMAVSEAKKLTLEFDRWSDSDQALRNWTLDKTSEMRGSEEGQEGLASFLEKRPPNWKEE
ncbi:MAG: enoyl-CoA hydratase-related protein [Candidatus Thermoplasmatota archaeon]|mgnify:FL=1|nr:enoyl-CoA hydratase-related protein [Candidatus Thermoplasmatota archaeon]MED5486690.1 enoyl-CoA hydratase-related protein [Candidatus Thermoplasmatota archaeon]